ncbi:URC4/urg3 family protein [Planktothrix sp. FACHB-1355]|uniref:URC4/urg3 family protein n=1 Tax=Aerosakkonema funiforme FACHB-1375 TaxID=2949571 RepID=A0A926VA08_9CYAN|nr:MULTISPECIES: URC4/urg3 family protein [Oscillatoriales]MBD2179538.1 URC4/urg3 family protein [Aerosakkonema funiforme FACHB-1375]MBD3561225.1 URC4/urg3 family protein [Planktothrix sp. FACHB-1355]
MKEEEIIAYLRTPTAIRERCDRIFKLACENKLNYFRVDLTKLDKCADYVIEVMREDYPNLEIPFHSRWRHFEVGKVSRLTELDRTLTELSPLEKAKVKFDLAIISVLLDAGAGASWQYREQQTGQVFRRSEGLAIASFRMFCQGVFSSNPDLPWQADAKKLQDLTAEALKEGFQVSAENPLVGVEGRLELLQCLGQVLTQNVTVFGTDNPRPGNMVDYLLDKKNDRLAASKVLSAVLEGLGEIWPGRLAIAGVNLGDMWIHPSLGGDRESDRYVPFHKLSQWLTYSLLEPLQEIGLEITGLDELTGLPEYRNGGLCLDKGLLELKQPDVWREPYPVGSEIIVEWRALTVALLDRIAAAIRQKLNMSAAELPLVKVLQGGTWSAGRKIASLLREGGVPPIQIQSDGTVF